MEKSHDDWWLRERLSVARQEYERKEMRNKMQDEMHQGTHRAARANRTASAILHALRDYIPEKYQREAYDDMALCAFWANVELIEVPPEHDHLVKLELERLTLESRRPA